MDPGLRFAIREGGRTVGAGVVAKVTLYSSKVIKKHPIGVFFYIYCSTIYL
jgi:hypothetical protein